MIPGQVLQKVIEDTLNIMKCHVNIIDTEGSLLVGNIQNMELTEETVDAFMRSDADSQEVKGYHLLKVYDTVRIDYVLIVQGSDENSFVIGKMLVSQLQTLLSAYKERLDKSTFIQNLLMDNLLLVDIYNRAKKMHISTEARRVVFMVETKYEKDSSAMETVKSIFAAHPKDYVTAVDEKNIIIVKELKEKDTTEEVQGIALMLVDMLNAEAMSQVRVSYGNMVGEIKDVSRSYKEAKMALDVGKIFYTEKTIIPYSNLGIGRLIYQLPLPLCKMFMKEVFGNQMPDSFDEETTTTISKFFDNSLNVSETARQLFVHRNTLVYRLEKLQKSTGLDIRVFDDALTFKIAMMVVNYMKYLESQDS